MVETKWRQFAVLLIAALVCSTGGSSRAVWSTRIQRYYTSSIDGYPVTTLGSYSALHCISLCTLNRNTCKASVFSAKQANAKFGICHLYTQEVVNGQIQRIQQEYFQGGVLNYVYGVLECPETHVMNPVSSTCIRLVRAVASWETAKANCEGSGEYLAAFDTLPSLEWMKQHRLDSSAEWRERLWIGLRDTGDWRWYGRVTKLVLLSDPIWYGDNPFENDEMTCGLLIGSGPNWTDRIYDDLCSTALLIHLRNGVMLKLKQFRA